MSSVDGVKRFAFEGENMNLIKISEIEKILLSGGEIKDKKEEQIYKKEVQEEENIKIETDQSIIDDFINNLNNENMNEKHLCIQNLPNLCQKIGADNVQNLLLPLLLQKTELYGESLEELANEILNNFHFFKINNAFPPSLFLFVNRLVGKREAEIKEKGICIYNRIIFESSDDFFMRKVKNEILKLAKHRGEEYRIGGSSIILFALKRVISIKNQDIAKHLINVYCELLKDKSLLVKRAAVKALQKYYEILRIMKDENWLWANEKINEAFELILELSHEENVQEAVRIMTCYAVESFICCFTFFDFDKILNVIQTLSCDTSWRVRCAVAELIENIFKQKCGDENFEKKCIPLFINLLKDRDVKIFILNCKM